MKAAWLGVVLVQAGAALAADPESCATVRMSDLGWHPINLTYDMTYLAGGDVEFGPDFGGAAAHTLSRKGYAAECPNVAKLFSQLVFDLDYENFGMQKIMGEAMEPSDTAKAMMAERPELLDL